MCHYTLGVNPRPKPLVLSCELSISISPGIALGVRRSDALLVDPQWGRLKLTGYHTKRAVLTAFQLFQTG